MVRFINAYTYGHWHIALCALLYYCGGANLLSGHIDWLAGLQVFASTQFVYSLHRYLAGSKLINPLNKRYSFIENHKGYTLIIMSISGLTALTSFIFLHPSIQFVLVLTGILSIGYILPLIFRKRLRDIGFSKIILIALVWAILPLLTSYRELSIENNILILSEQFFFIFALTIPFDVRDQSLDERTKVSNLANHLGLSRIKTLMVICLVFSMCLVCMLAYKGIYSRGLLLYLLVFYSVQYFTTSDLTKTHDGLYYLLLLDGMIGIKGGVYLLMG